MMTDQRATPGVQHFEIGTEVQHRIYGCGTVIEPDRYTRGDMVRVQLDHHGVIRLVASSVWPV